MGEFVRERQTVGPPRVPEQAEVEVEEGDEELEREGGGEGRDRKVVPVISKEEKEVIRLKPGGKAEEMLVEPRRRAMKRRNTQSGSM